MWALLGWVFPFMFAFFFSPLLSLFSLYLLFVLFPFTDSLSLLVILVLCVFLSAAMPKVWPPWLTIAMRQVQAEACDYRRRILQLRSPPLAPHTGWRDPGLACPHHR